jgi:hypothetical protein
MKVEVNSLVRAGEIKHLEDKGVVAEYEVFEFTRQDIIDKTEIAVKYYDSLKQLLEIKTKQYVESGMETDEQENKKLNLLIDIEELVYTFAWYNEVSWVDVWNRAKLGSMNTFAKYARVGEPTFAGCVKEYLTFEDKDDLSYIETALFDELKKFSASPSFYFKFQDIRKAKKNRLGGYKAGHYLKSIEYANIQGQNK